MAQLSVPWLQEVEKGEAGDAVAPIILGSQKNISYVFFFIFVQHWNNEGLWPTSCCEHQFSFLVQEKTKVQEWSTDIASLCPSIPYSAHTITYAERWAAWAHVTLYLFQFNKIQFYHLRIWARREVKAVPFLLQMWVHTVTRERLNHGRVSHYLSLLRVSFILNIKSFTSHLDSFAFQ